MAGDRHVAEGADGHGAAVARRGHAPLADIGQEDVEAGVAVKHRDGAVAGGRTDERRAFGNRKDERADRVEHAPLVLIPQRHPVGLVLERRRNVDAGHRAVGELIRVVRVRRELAAVTA